jgi:hypothetical protein
MTKLVRMLVAAGFAGGLILTGAGPAVAAPTISPSGFQDSDSGNHTGDGRGGGDAAHPDNGKHKAEGGGRNHNPHSVSDCAPLCD